MIAAILRVMALELLRDRGALAMAFALPAAIYLIFASIFSGTSGDTLQLSVAVFDQAQTESSRRIVTAMADDARLVVTLRPASRDGVEQAVRRGDVDAGVVVRADPALPATEAPLVVLGDASRPVAAPVVVGRLQKILGDDQAGAAEKPAAAPLVELAQIARAAHADAPTVYYAGAVGILFLLISASQGAMLLIDERRNAILDRLTSSAGGLAKAVSGKFLFLTLQGAVQVGIIFAVAAALYGVAVTERLAGWSLVTLSAAAMAAGAALLLCAVCRTRQQAQTLSAFLVMILSAVGGSMIPRYLMPRWLQDVSLLTPNAWAIEAYQDLLWRGADAGRIAFYAALLVGFGVASATLAWAFLLRERRG